MKKITLAFILFAALSLVACNKKAECSKEGKKECTEKKQEVKAESSGEFENKGIAEYISVYESYIKEYKDALKSHDMAKFEKLATKEGELAKKAEQLYSSGLSEADTKKFEAYMQKSMTELEKFTREAMK